MRSVWLGYAEGGRRRSGDDGWGRGVDRVKSLTRDEGEHEAQPDARLPDPDHLADIDEAGIRRNAPLQSSGWRQTT